VTLSWDQFQLDEPTLVSSAQLPYLAMVASVLEGRAIDQRELLQLLRRAMRQRSIGRWARRDYVLHYLKQQAHDQQQRVLSASVHESFFER
jgi:hypothetical protein